MFHALDVPVIVVTNQRGVSLGLVDPQELARMHANMCRELSRLDAPITDVFCCPHEENTCECRKPKPKMIIILTIKIKLKFLLFKWKLIV